MYGHRWFGDIIFEFGKSFRKPKASLWEALAEGIQDLVRCLRGITFVSMKMISDDNLLHSGYGLGLGKMIWAHSLGFVRYIRKTIL